jgi:hypothetical protein
MTSTTERTEVPPELVAPQPGDRNQLPANMHNIMVGTDPTRPIGDPLAFIAHVSRACRELGLGEVLTTPRRLLAQAEELSTAAWSKQQDADVRYGTVVGRLAAGEATVDELVAEVGELAPWRRAELGQESAAYLALSEAAAQVRGRAWGITLGEVGGLYDRLKGVAADAVAATAAVPSLPPLAWSSPDPSRVLAKAGRATDLTVLVEQNDRYAEAHRLAARLRDTGQMGSSVLFNREAPDKFCIEFLAPEKAATEVGQLRPIAKVLWLRYAVEHGWQPGLWLASDHQAPEPPKRRALLAGWVSR